MGTVSTYHVAQWRTRLTFNICRSVHNQRIERIWLDVRRGFGQKWKDHFVLLQAHEGLDISKPELKWLLHHISLPVLREEAAEWVRTWNAHKLRIKGERQRSPQGMFLFGQVQEGARGLSYLVPRAIDENEEIDEEAYGVDYDHIDDAENEEPTEDPFPPVMEAPANINVVVCDEPNCPFTQEEVEYLDRELSRRVDVMSHNMTIRRRVWVEAKAICAQIWNGNVVL